MLLCDKLCFALSFDLDKLNVAISDFFFQVKLSYLCLRTKGAGGIMFPGCPSVRPSGFSFTR